MTMLLTGTNLVQVLLADAANWVKSVQAPLAAGQLAPPARADFFSRLPPLRVSNMTENMAGVIRFA
jgi:hypothetical protein